MNVRNTWENYNWNIYSQLLHNIKTKAKAWMVCENGLTKMKCYVIKKSKYNTSEMCLVFAWIH